MNNNEKSFFQVINNKFLLKKIFYWVHYINTFKYHCISLRYNEIDSIEWMIENNLKSLLYYKLKSNYKNLIFNKNSIQRLFKLIYQDHVGSGGGSDEGDTMTEIIYSNYFNSHLKYYDMVTLLSNDNSNIGALKILWCKYPGYPCSSLSVDNCIYKGQLVILDYLLSKCCKYTESRLVGNAIQSLNRNSTMKYLIEKKLVNGSDNHHHKSGHSSHHSNSVVQVFSQLDLKSLESNMYEFEFLVIQYFDSIGLFNQSSKTIYKSSNPILLFKKKQKASIRNSGGSGTLKIIDEYNNLYSTIQIFIFYQKKYNGTDYNSDLNLSDFQNYTHQNNQSTTAIPIPPDSTILEQFKRLYILFIKVILHSNNKHEMFNEEDVYMMVSKFSIQYNDITQLKSNLPLGKAYRDKFRFSKLFEMCIEYCNSDILLELVKQYCTGNDYSFFSFKTNDHLYSKPLKSRLLKSMKPLEIQESRKETLSFFERLLTHYTTNVKYSSENFKRKSYTGIPKVSSVDGSYVIATSTLSCSNNSISSANSSSTTTTPSTTPCALIGDQDNLITVIVSIFDSLISHYPLEDIESAFKLMIDYEIGDYVDAFGTLKLSKNAATIAAQRGNFSIFQFIYNNRSKFYWDENVFNSSLGNKHADIVSFILNHMEHIINYSTALDTATIYCNPEIISILINHESSRNNKSFQCCETSFMRALRTNNTVFRYLFYHCQDEPIPQSISKYINNHNLLSLFINLPSEYYCQHKQRFIKSINEINSMTVDLNFLSDYYFPSQFLKLCETNNNNSITSVTSNHLISLCSKNQFNQVIEPILKLIYPDNSFINSPNRNNSLKLLFKNLIQNNQLPIFKKLYKHFNYLFIQPSSTSTGTMDNNVEFNNWYNVFIKSLPMVALENHDYNIFNFLALECGIANDVDSLNPVSLLNVIQNCPLSFVDHLFSSYQFSKLISIIISDIITSSTTLSTSPSSQQIVNSNNNTNNTTTHEITIENDNINLLSNSKIPNIKYIYCKYLNNSNNTSSNDINNSNNTNSTLFTLKKSFSKIFKSSKKLK